MESVQCEGAALPGDRLRYLTNRQGSWDRPAGGVAPRAVGCSERDAAARRREMARGRREGCISWQGFVVCCVMTPATPQPALAGLVSLQGITGHGSVPQVGVIVVVAAGSRSGVRQGAGSRVVVQRWSRLCRVRASISAAGRQHRRGTMAGGDVAGGCGQLVVRGPSGALIAATRRCATCPAESLSARPAMGAAARGGEPETHLARMWLRRRRSGGMNRGASAGASAPGTPA